MKQHLINLILVLWVTLLVLNLFWPNREKEESLKTWIEITAESAVTVPNLPKIYVKNYESKELRFNTCDNIVFNKNSKIIDKSIIPKEFCKDLVVNPKESVLLDIKDIHSLFQVPAKFILEYSDDSNKSIITFDVEEKWFFNSLFSKALYAPVYNAFIILIDKLPNHSLWIAIIIITILLKLVLILPQQKMLVSQKRMQEIQPKIKEIQVKYKWKQAELWQKMMELYKKEWVNPLGSCMPLLIQMPILIVLYWVIIEITDMSNLYYLYDIVKNFDLSTINTSFIGLDLLWAGWIWGILLALTVTWTQFLQMKLGFNTPSIKQKDLDMANKVLAPKWVTWPELDPAFIQKSMMYAMPVMVWVFTFMFPAWAWLYWFVSTLFALLQQIYVKKSTK